VASFDPPGSVQEASMKSVQIDRNKRLKDQPSTGHNRFHPDIPPIVVVEEGEEVVLETRDGVDGQLGPATTEADIANMESGAIHPLTGPVFVKGAQPGDVLEIEFLDVVPQPHAFTAIVPGLGFLRDVMTNPFLVHWQLKDGWATSAQLPGVRIPGAPFMGVSAVAPSAAKLAEWTAREQRVIDKGGMALPPDSVGAVPTGPCGLAGLRTLPPRENGGNFDVKQLTRGAKLFLPVFKEGGLFSTGDAHFAQGDGEVCVTAVEMGATAVVRFKLHKGLATRRKFSSPVFSRETYFTDPRFAAPERLLGVMGMPINADGEIEAENLTLACRNAVLNMIELLQERGFSREQAYVICSVAVDLRVSNVVDVPNYVVSALLPEAIFDGD
jgi:formamidase